MEMEKYKIITIGDFNGKFGSISNNKYSSFYRVGKKVYRGIGLFAIRGEHYPYAYGYNGLFIIVSENDYKRVYESFRYFKKYGKHKTILY